MPEPSIIKGQRDSKGTTAQDLEPWQGEVISLLKTIAGDKPLKPKYSAEEVDYTQDGPFPFVCQSCANYIGDMCKIVEGPYEDGGVADEDTCRLWEPNPVMSRMGRPKEE